MHLKKPSTLVVGLALFSMFFGSGNLIFPLYVGNISQGSWPWAVLGFIITGVLVPFSGIIAMVVFHGDYKRFFGCLGKPLGFLLTALLLTIWIPLGSGPRCVALSYASLLPYVWLPPLWIFSIIFCALVFLVVHHKNRIIPVLGYILTPLLLLCLSALTIKGIIGGSPSATNGIGPLSSAFSGVKEGYNTMDLIASFFFSASIIALLKRSDLKHRASLKLALRAGVIGMGLIAVVYLGLIYIASINGEALTDIPKEQLLAIIAKTIMGQQLGIIAAFAIVLACFTTAVALVVVYADFLKEYVIKRCKKHNGLISMNITLAVTFVMSLFGLQGITTVTAPVLKICYPILMILIIYNVSKALYLGKKAGVPVEEIIEGK